MNKRKFLRSAGLGVAAIGLSPFILQSCHSEKEENFKLWVWTGGDKPKEQWESEFKTLRDFGFHGVLCGGGRKVLEKTVPIAQKHGLEIHSWMWVMNQPGNKEAQAHPEWYAVSREGHSSLDVRPYVDYYQWLCPNKEEVQEYLINRMLEVAQIDGLAGVQLDYIRFCDVILPKGLWAKYNLVQDHEMPPYDYCYCGTCRSKFKAQTGYDPLDLDDPSQDQKWIQFRYDSITNMVNMIAKEVHGINKKVSASVFATPSRARKLVRQAWDEWDLDFVFPMIYYDFYEENLDFVESGTREGVNAMKNKPVYTAQYLHNKTEEDVKGMIDATKKGGAMGLAFYDYRLIKDEFFDIIKAMTA